MSPFLVTLTAGVICLLMLVAMCLMNIYRARYATELVDLHFSLEALTYIFLLVIIQLPTNFLTYAYIARFKAPDQPLPARVAKGLQSIDPYFSPLYFAIDPYFAQFWRFWKPKIRVAGLYVEVISTCSYDPISSILYAETISNTLLLDVFYGNKCPKNA